MKATQRAIDIIEKWEGFRGTRYLCPAGLWTIGYGTRWREGMPLTCTENQAMVWLLEAVAQIEADVNSLVAVPLTQNQFDALVSWTYNCGSDIDEDTIPEGLGDSALLRLLNQGDYRGAADQIPLWHHVHGKDMPGLVNRRAEERALFLESGPVPIPGPEKSWWDKVKELFGG